MTIPSLYNSRMPIKAIRTNNEHNNTIHHNHTCPWYDNCLRILSHHATHGYARGQIQNGTPSTWHGNTGPYHVYPSVSGTLPGNTLCTWYNPDVKNIYPLSLRLGQTRRINYPGTSCAHSPSNDRLCYKQITRAWIQGYQDSWYRSTRSTPYLCSKTRLDTTHSCNALQLRIANAGYWQVNTWR